MSPYLYFFFYAVPIGAAIGFVIAFFEEDEWKDYFAGIGFSAAGGAILAMFLCMGFSTKISNDYTTQDLHHNYPDIVVVDISSNMVTFDLEGTRCKTQWSYDVGSTDTVLWTDKMQCQYGDKVPVLQRQN